MPLYGSSSIAGTRLAKTLMNTEIETNIKINIYIQKYLDLPVLELHMNS